MMCIFWIDVGVEEFWRMVFFVDVTRGGVGKFGSNKEVTREFSTFFLGILRTSC